MMMEEEGQTLRRGRTSPPLPTGRMPCTSYFRCIRWAVPEAKVVKEKVGRVGGKEEAPWVNVEGIRTLKGRPPGAPL